MKIILNGQVQAIEAVTLAALVEELNYGNKTVAIALNETFVPKSNYEQTVLNEGDQIEIVAPMQGG